MHKVDAWQGGLYWFEKKKCGIKTAESILVIA